MFRLNRNDLALIAMIAQHRILNLDQLAVGTGGSKEAVGKRVKRLEKRGWLVPESRGFGRGRGRPEKLISVSPKGAQILRDKELLPRDICDELITASSTGSIDHLLLTNWILVQVAALSRRAPFLATHHHSYASPFSKRPGNGVSLLYDQVHLSAPDTPVGFEPDVAFSVHHSELNKSLLFLVEVDMATEDLGNPDRSPGDVRHKIRCYQAYFGTGGYKRYEDLWHTEFNGFRLLFLTSTHKHLVTLCKLTREMPPSDFVWLSDQRRMLADGLYETIWIRGGNGDRARESILGSQLSRFRTGLHPGRGGVT